MYIVAKIHNNSLGKVVQAKDEADAKDIAKGWAEEQFQRPLTDEEVDDLENTFEVYNEDDADNLHCISIGIVE